MFSVNHKKMYGLFSQIKGQIELLWGRIANNENMAFDGYKNDFYGRLQRQDGQMPDETVEEIQELKDSIEPLTQRGRDDAKSMARWDSEGGSS